MPSLLLALTLALQPAPDETLSGLQRTFAEACAGRLYGQYDDMCSGLADQIRAYRAEARRRPAHRPAAASLPADASPTAGVAPPPPHEPLPPSPPR